MPYGKQELTINLQVAGDLYKKLEQAASGYTGAVPIIHQAAALKAVVDALDYAFGEDRGTNFPQGSGQSAPPSGS
jgi:hypothetical protein